MAAVREPDRGQETELRPPAHSFGIPACLPGVRSFAFAMTPVLDVPWAVTADKVAAVVSRLVAAAAHPGRSILFGS